MVGTAGASRRPIPVRRNIFLVAWLLIPVSFPTSPLTSLPSRHNHWACKDFRRPISIPGVLPTLNEAVRFCLRFHPGIYPCSSPGPLSVKCVVPFWCLKTLVICHWVILDYFVGTVVFTGHWFRERWGKQTDIS